MVSALSVGTEGGMKHDENSFFPVVLLLNTSRTRSLLQLIPTIQDSSEEIYSVHNRGDILRPGIGRKVFCQLLHGRTDSPKPD